jgi:hypothetical protein
MGSLDVPSIDQAKGLTFTEVSKLGEDILIVATPVREN